MCVTEIDTAMFNEVWGERENERTFLENFNFVLTNSELDPKSVQNFALASVFERVVNRSSLLAVWTFYDNHNHRLIIQFPNKYLSRRCSMQAR